MVFDPIASDITADDVRLERAATVLGEHDSGCQSFAVDFIGRRWFVKTAQDARGQQSLENALRFRTW